MEIFDIVDERGQPTGAVVERTDAHARGVLHRTAHVWIVRQTESGTQVLLQKRSMEKDSFPGLYDTSSAGHIPAGDEPLPSALRELSEELGIHAEAGELHEAGTFRIRYEEEFHGKLFRDNEFTFVYVYEKPVDADALSLQPEEVDEVRWFDLSRVRAELHDPDTIFCMPEKGLSVLLRYLEEKKRI